MAIQLIDCRFHDTGTEQDIAVCNDEHLSLGYFCCLVNCLRSIEQLAAGSADNKLTIRKYSVVVTLNPLESPFSMTIVATIWNQERNFVIQSGSPPLLLIDLPETGTLSEGCP